MQGIATLLVQLISQHGVLAVMLGMVIEEIIVPVPSPVVPMAAGVLLVDASTSFGVLMQLIFVITIPASIASVLSSYFVYGVAYRGGKPVLQRYGRYLDVRWEDVQNLEENFVSGRDGYYVALFRAVPVVPLSLVSGSAGLFRMDWKRYGMWSFAGMMVRNFILAVLGWTLQDEFMRVASRIESASSFVLLSVILVFILLVVQRNSGRVYRKVFDWMG